MNTKSFFAAAGCSFCAMPADRIPPERTVVRGLNCAICEDCIGLCGDVLAARDRDRAGRATRMETAR